MRWLVCLVMLVMLVMPIAYAQEDEGGLISNVLDRAKPVLLWDMRGDRLLGGIQASVISYKGLISLDAGAITDLNNNAFLLGLSGNIQALAAKYGIDFNLPEAVSLGAFYGRDFSGDKEWMAGVSLSYSISW